MSQQVEESVVYVGDKEYIQDQYSLAMDSSKKGKMNFNNANKSSNQKQNSFENTFVSNSNNMSRSYGISQFQSSQTLQNSIYSWTIPKGERFQNSYKKSLTDSIYKIPEQRNFRATTMGLGERSQIFKICQSPSPNNYKIRTCFEESQQHKKGVVIGNKISYKDSETGKVPGPCEYDTLKTVTWKLQNPPTLKFRHGFYYDEEMKNKQALSPQQYKPSYKASSPSRFENIGIGIGYGTKNWGKTSMKVPGPGEYNLPSIFDKRRKYKYALN